MALANTARLLRSRNRGANEFTLYAGPVVSLTGDQELADLVGRLGVANHQIVVEYAPLHERSPPLSCFRSCASAAIPTDWVRAFWWVTSPSGTFPSASPRASFLMICR